MLFLLISLLVMPAEMLGAEQKAADVIASGEIVIDFKPVLDLTGPDGAQGLLEQAVCERLGMTHRVKRGVAGVAAAGVGEPSRPDFLSFGSGEPLCSSLLLVAQACDRQSQAGDRQAQATNQNAQAIARQNQILEEMGRSAAQKASAKIAKAARLAAEQKSKDRKACCLAVLNGAGIVVSTGIAMTSLILSSKQKQD